MVNKTLEIVGVVGDQTPTLNTTIFVQIQNPKVLDNLVKFTHVFNVPLFPIRLHFILSCCCLEILTRWSLSRSLQSWRSITHAGGHVKHHRPQQQLFLKLHPATTTFPTDTMRWFQVLTASLLPFTALAAKKTGDKFVDARAKSLEIGRPLKLDDGGYQSLTKGQRDFSTVVLLTALETRFGCVLCREFQPEWDLLGKSWAKGDKDGQTRTLFGTLDFVDGKNTFQSVRSIAI